jgi:hypothetical protein
LPLKLAAWLGVGTAALATGVSNASLRGVAVGLGRIVALHRTVDPRGLRSFTGLAAIT